MRGMGEEDREFARVLATLVGRPLSPNEIAEALGLSRSAYYLQREEGRLISPDNLVRVARTLGLNPVDLLLQYGMVTPDEVVESAGVARTAAKPARRKLRRVSLDMVQPRSDVPPI